MTHASGAQISYKMGGREHLIRADIMEAQNVTGFPEGFSIKKKKKEMSKKVRMRRLSTCRGRVQKRGALRVFPGRHW